MPQAAIHLPDPKTIGYLDPEIAAEGISADGWQPEISPPNIPSYDKIKSIKRYFPQFTGRPYKHQPYPAWLYHPTDDAVLVKTAEQAARYGVEFRETTREERAQGWPAQRWVYAENTKWRSTPFEPKFDPANPGMGKSLVFGTANPALAQSAMITAVVAAVMQQMQAGAPATPGGAPTALALDADYVEFQAFKAWKAQMAGGEQGDLLGAAGEGTASNALSPAGEANEREQLIAQAKEKGIEVDGRWSLKRLREALD